MSEVVHLISVLKPKPGNTAKVIELLKPYIANVEANEPGVLQYQLFSRTNDDGSEDLVYVEQFKDQESLTAHVSTPASIALKESAKENGLLASPPDIKVVKPVAGFAQREYRP